MIKQQTERTEILQLLFHEETLSDAVAQASLTASVHNSNSDTLKCTLKHLYCANKLYEGQLRVLLGQSTDPVITEYLQKYQARVLFRERGLFASLCLGRDRCSQQTIIEGLRKAAPIGGFLITMVAHLLIMGLIFGLNLQKHQLSGISELVN